MTEIRFCSEHQYFEGERCSECTRRGVEILNHDKQEQVSSFLSGLLRHFADDFDLYISDNGWASYQQVLEIVGDKYGLTESQLLAIITMDDKGRYEIDNNSIRAVYGHSIDNVSIDDTSSDNTPSTLYHGTAPRHQDAIQAEGIQPQSRNQVHLSKQRQDAVQVGHRHSDSERVIVFKVNAEQLVEDGYTVKTTNGDVFTVDEVPPEYLTEVEEATMQEIAQIQE